MNRRAFIKACVAALAVGGVSGKAAGVVLKPACPRASDVANLTPKGIPLLDKCWTVTRHVESRKHEWEWLNFERWAENDEGAGIHERWTQDLVLANGEWGRKWSLEWACVMGWKRLPATLKIPETWNNQPYKGDRVDARFGWIGGRRYE